MNDARLEILLEMHRYNAQLGQAYLEYRERLTQMMTYIYTALFGLVFALKLSLLTLPFPLLMIAMSRFAEGFVLKFYERSEYHFHRARRLRHYLDVELEDGGKTIEKIFAEALKKHVDVFKVTTRHGWRDRLLSAHVHDSWAALHRMFFVMGLLLFLAVIANFLLSYFAHISLDFGGVDQALGELLDVGA